MSKKLSSTQAREAARIFAALGDDMRLKIVTRLCAGGPLSIARLSEGNDITRQAITKHLHVLEHAGVLQGCRRGREQIWELKGDSLQEARRCLDTISLQWDNALDRLKMLVEEDEG